MKDPGIHEPRHVNQIDLIAAISRHIEKRHGYKSLIPRQFNAIIKAADGIVESFEQPFRKAPAGCGGSAWISSDERGASSEFMAHVLGGAAKQPVIFRVDNNHPHDADDFGRCVTLLNAIPQLRPHLKVMAEHGPVWAALVDRWDELERDPSLVRGVVEAAKKEPTP